MDIWDILSNNSLFDNYTREQIEETLSKAFYQLRKKSKDIYIAKMGDVCNDVIILLNGTVYTTMAHNDKEIVIETIKAPEMLAPAFIYGQSNIFPVNIITKTDCSFMYINKLQFLDLLSKNKNMMTNFIKILSNRCSFLSKRVQEENLQSLKERTIDYLNRFGKIDNINWLARKLGVARPSLSRIISELRKDQIVEDTSDGIRLKKQ